MHYPCTQLKKDKDEKKDEDILRPLEPLNNEETVQSLRNGLGMTSNIKTNERELRYACMKIRDWMKY